MKKAISMILAIAVLCSLSCAGFAEERGNLTVDRVLERLNEGEDASETAAEQAANGALRLAEMTVMLDSLSIETQEEADHLNNILDALAGIDIPEESAERKIAVGLIRTLEGLAVFEQQVDREGIYEDYLDQVLESYSSNDSSAETAMQQAVNSLFHSVILSSLIAREMCTTQRMINQVEAELDGFYAENEAAADTNEQLACGAEYLYRMLTGMASRDDKDGSLADDNQESSERAYAADEENAEDITFRVANWFCSCVGMTALIARQLKAE